MEKKHSANEKLDAVLIVLNDASNSLMGAVNFERLHISSELKLSVILFELTEMGFNDIDSSELAMILEHLIDESYIKSIERTEQDTMNLPPQTTKFYKIIFKGKVFIENGGYTQKEKIVKREIFRQTLAIWITAIGTGLAGIYGLFEILKWLGKTLCFC